MTFEQLTMLLSAGVQHGASDVHFKVGESPTYRVNGALVPLKYDKLKAPDVVDVCGFLIADPAVKQRLDTLQEHDTSFSLPGVSRFRVNVYRQRGTLSVVLRLIPQTVPSLEELGLPTALKTIAEADRGIVLVCGETTSGKTSTLAAMVNHINTTRRAHVLTIEDPIEYVHTNVKASISQREIGLDTESFPVALRAALRQDPDVILVSELRDVDTIDLALRAAETGHLVLAALRTTDASRAVLRMTSVFPADDEGPARQRLAEQMRAIVSQKLLPRAAGRGLAVACELLLPSKQASECIRHPDKLDQLYDVIARGHGQDGTQTLDQHLTELFKANVVTFEAAKGAANDPAAFERALHFE